jgi:predicted enzyme related to lactoylglutathione lyase
MSSSKKPSIENLSGVLIYTEDLERLVAFYQNTLGLTPQSLKAQTASFQLRNNTRITLGKHSEVKGQTRNRYRIMVNFSTDDIQASYTHLLAKGVRFIRPPEQETWGGWVTTFSDPDDNILQLLQFPTE